MLLVGASSDYIADPAGPEFYHHTMRNHSARSAMARWQGSAHGISPAAFGFAASYIKSVLNKKVPLKAEDLAAAGPLVLRSAALRVALDTALPRPTSIRHLWTGTDFSPPHAALPVGAPEGNAPPPQRWWRHVANHALLNPQGGEGCARATPHCRPLPQSFPKGQGATKCQAACDAAQSCVAWTVLKDTPSSGQRGKGDLCELFEKGGLAKAAPFYASDRNFDCGSKAQLQPQPPGSNPSPPRPPPAPPHRGGGAARPTACVGIVALNGSVTEFCGSETTTRYTSRTTNSTTDAVNWELVLTKASSGVAVTLVGTLAVETDSSISSASVLSWSLLSASSAQITVRACDLGFAFVGLSGKGDGYYYTKSTKHWCPPGVGCMAWSTAEMSGTVGVEEAPAPASGLVEEGWSPPSPLPAAAQALLDPSRSNAVGAWTADGSAAVGAFSSQLTLPFRRYSTSSGATDIGFGSARINTRLRCGDVLPVTLRFGFVSDITTDGRADADDCTVWTRSNYPVADFVFRGALIMKIDNDVSSYLPPWNPCPQRVSFNETLRYVEAIAALSDNMPTVLHLVGWGGTGLDTGMVSR